MRAQPEWFRPTRGAGPSKWAGSTPYEVLGRVPFPVITEEPYAITLPPYGFLWFDLVQEERPE